MTQFIDRGIQMIWHRVLYPIGMLLFGLFLVYWAGAMIWMAGMTLTGHMQTPASWNAPANLAEDDRAWNQGCNRGDKC